MMTIVLGWVEMIYDRVSQLTVEPTPTGFSDDDNYFGVG